MSNLDSTQAALDARFPATLVVVGEANVAVRQCGIESGTTYVLLHGISSGAGSWLDCAVSLGAQGRVIAWDAPGYGASTPFDVDAPTPEHFANRLAELLDAMKIESCVLVGHSLGALMAVAFATGPDRAKVSRLLLISPAGGYGSPDKVAQRAEVLERRSGDLQRLGIAGLVDPLPKRLLSANATEAQMNQVRWNASRLDAGGYMQAVHMLCNADMARYVDKPKPPTRVACGDVDVVTTPSACRQWASKLDAPFTAIANAGHASPIERPEAVASLIAH